MSFTFNDLDEKQKQELKEDSCMVSINFSIVCIAMAKQTTLIKPWAVLLLYGWVESMKNERDKYYGKI